MKKIVWTFGLISGAVMGLFLIATIPFIDAIGDNGLIVGYTGFIAAFLLVYFGVRSYRDNILGGTIRFGRALSVGLLIATIGSLCYVATWEVLYYKFIPDFYSNYAKSAVERVRKSGKSEAEIEKTRAFMDDMAKKANNPAWVAAMTFIEPFPVGIVVALVSAGVLSRRRSRDPVLATA